MSTLNYAKKLTDQMLIYVSEKGEAKPVATTVQASSSDVAGSSTTATDTATTQSATGTKVELNTATKDQLLQVDGIGDKKADKIIEYRKQHGPFKNLTELKDISGIGDKTYQKLKEHLTLR